MAFDVNSLPVLSVDLVAASRRSGGALAKLEADLVDELVTRYRMFLYLKSINPELSFAPTGLIDEIWHLHMLHPKAYWRDCQTIFGEILDHNPGFGYGEGEAAKLLKKFDNTEALWKATFGTEYVDENLGARCGLEHLTAVIMCDDKGEEKEGPKSPSKTPSDAPEPTPPEQPKAITSALT